MADPRSAPLVPRFLLGEDGQLIPQPTLAPSHGPAAPPLVTGRLKPRPSHRPSPPPPPPPLALGAGKATGISADPRVPSREGASGLANQAMSFITGYPVYPEDTAGPVDMLMAAGPIAAAGSKPIKALLAGEQALAHAPQAKALLQSASPEALARLADQFPAFASDLKRYGPGEALPEALGHLSDVLMQTDTPGKYALKPEVQARIAHFLELGRGATRQANWQGSTSDEILKAFDNDKELADIWARMTGATSAGTNVPRNVEETVQGMQHLTRAKPQSFTKKLLQKWGFGLPEAKYSNMNLAQLQEMLSGDKVEAFAQLMRDLDRIPLDRHAVYALGGSLPHEGEAQLARHLNPLREYFGLLEGRPPKYREGTGALYGTVNKSEAYNRVEQAFADTLRTLDPDTPLKDVFAQMWEGVREHRGGKFQGGPIDLLGPRGLLERGAMTDPKRMLRALKMTPGKEWTPALLFAALASLAPEASASSSSESAPAAPLARPGSSPR